MKNVFIVALFSLIGLSVFSKNYELIKTDGVFYYGTYSYKISHITNLSNGIMCYPIPTAQFISVEEGRTINPTTSLLGDSIYIASNGGTRFFNAWGFSLFFIPFDDFEPWIVYSDDLGTQITGQYTGLASGEIMPGYIGDFAILQLQVKDFSGNPLTDHPLHLKELRVSKEFGFMEFFRMDEFRGIHHDYYSNSFKLRKLTALQTSTETIGKQPRFDKITTSLEIGTEIHFTYEGLFANDFFFFEIKKTVTDKVINSPYITYSFTKCVHIYDHHYDTAYTEEVTELYHYRSILNQVLDSFDITGQNGFRRATNYGTGIEESFYMPYFDYDIYYKISEFEMDSILLWWIKPDDQLAHSQTPGHRFINELGNITYYRGEEYQGDQIVYYKTPYEEWGTPLDFSCPSGIGIGESSNPEIRIYPNPATSFVRIDSPVLVNIVRIYDVQGRLMKQIELQGRNTFQINELEGGFYLIELYSGTELQLRQKLLVD